MIERFLKPNAKTAFSKLFLSSVPPQLFNEYTVNFQSTFKALCCNESKSPAPVTALSAITGIMPVKI